MESCLGNGICNGMTKLIFFLLGETKGRDQKVLESVVRHHSGQGPLGPFNVLISRHSCTFGFKRE